MKIRRNFTAFCIPIILAVLLLIGSGVTWIFKLLDEKLTFVIYIALGVAALMLILVLISFLSSSLRLKNRVIVGRVGLFKRKEITTPLSDVIGCEYRKLFSCVKITVKDKATAKDKTVTFRNMKKASEFVAYVNAESAALQAAEIVKAAEIRPDSAD